MINSATFSRETQKKRYPKIDEDFDMEFDDPVIKSIENL